MPRQRKSRRGKPDDYFRAGPFEMARFGKVIVSQWNGSAEDSKAIQERMARDLPKISAEIDMLVENIPHRGSGSAFTSGAVAASILVGICRRFSSSRPQARRSGGVDADARICPECNRLCEADDRVI